MAVNLFANLQARQKALGYFSTAPKKVKATAPATNSAQSQLTAPTLPDSLTTLPTAPTNNATLPTAPTVAPVKQIAGTDPAEAEKERLRRKQGILASIGGSGDSGGFFQALMKAAKLG